MRLITITQFLDMYENGQLTEVVFVKDKVYARSTLGQADNPAGYEIVYAVVP